MPSLRVVLRAAPWIALAAAVHLALLAWLALFRFPRLFLREHRAESAAPSMFVSALVHAGLLIALATVAWHAELQSALAPSLLLVGLAEVDPETPTLALLPQASASPDGDGSGGAAETQSLGGSPGDPLSIEGLDISDMHAESSGNGRSVFDGKGEGDGAKLARELGGKDAGKGTGGKGAADFFGVTAGGNDFVFVVDMSGSMQGSRWRRARNELRRSIESLTEKQRFFIVLYSTEAHPMPAEGLLEATKKNVGDAVHWLNKIEPQGSTNPLPAMLMAMQLKPDAVFLLSDGDFSPLVATQISAFQTIAIPVHAIGFESRVGERSLKLIADETKGTYRFVR